MANRRLVLLVVIGTSCLSPETGSIRSVSGVRGSGAPSLMAYPGSYVDASQFGAVGDGVADDTAALQAAIDYALQVSPRPPPVVLPGRHRLTSSLIINRPVDTTPSELRIIALGPGAGLYTTAPIAMVDSTLPLTPGPRSEAVTFEGVQFEASDDQLGAQVMTDAFLRIKFINCNFRKIRAVAARTYLQTWRFIGCNIRRWSGSFIGAPYAYDLSFIGSVAEDATASDAVLVRLSDGVHAGCVGCAFMGNLIEGLRGGALAIGGSAGTSIIGNYFEANGSPSIQLGLPGPPHSGLTVFGNFHVTQNGDAADWAIRWGPTEDAISGGNYCAGRLHDMSDLSPQQRAKIRLVGGDTGTAGTWSNPPHDLLASAISTDRGDTSQTLTVGVDAATQQWASELTGPRTVTLSKENAVSGDRFRIVRTGLGAFELDVGPRLKVIPASTAAFVEVGYDGAAWRLIGYGQL